MLTWQGQRGCSLSLCIHDSFGSISKISYGQDHAYYLQLTGSIEVLQGP